MEAPGLDLPRLRQDPARAHPARAGPRRDWAIAGASKELDCIPTRLFPARSQLVLVSPLLPRDRDMLMPAARARLPAPGDQPRSDRLRAARLGRTGRDSKRHTARTGRTRAAASALSSWRRHRDRLADRAAVFQQPGSAGPTAKWADLTAVGRRQKAESNRLSAFCFLPDAF